VTDLAKPTRTAQALWGTRLVLERALWDHTRSTGTGQSGKAGILACLQRLVPGRRGKRRGWNGFVSDVRMFS